MDDFVIIGGDKRELWQIKREIEGFLKYRLGLRLNGKSGIFPISQGIDFLGYRIWPNHRRLRKRSVKRMRRALKYFERAYREGKIDLERINATIQSWLGHAKRANTYRLRQKLLDSFVLVRSDNNLEPGNGLSHSSTKDA
jgi:hypothetical protein